MINTTIAAILIHIQIDVGKIMILSKEKNDFVLLKNVIQIMN